MSCKHPTLNDKLSQTLRVGLFTPQSYKNKFTQQIISQKISKKNIILPPLPHPTQQQTSSEDNPTLYEAYTKDIRIFAISESRKIFKAFD